MSWETLLAFNIAILGALGSPGPAFVVMIKSAFTQGRWAALRCGLGLSVAAVCWTLLALLGLSAVFAVVPWAYAALKLLGAAYLIWLAISLWRGADKPLSTSAPKGLSGFRLGFLTNILNPKAVFFLAAIFTTIFPTMPTGSDAVIIVLNHFALEATWYFGAALLLSTGPARDAYLRLKARFDRMAAVVLGAMAARVAS